MIQITEDHKYYNNRGVEYVGVSSLIGMYKQPKDWLAIATKYAKKNGHDALYWLQKWEKNKVQACDRGHVFHDYKENQVLDRGVVKVDRAVRMVRNQNLYPNIRSLFNLPDGAYTELRVWDDAYMYAGTADRVDIETVGNGVRFVDIDDYKTNGKIDVESYQRYDGTRDMMLHPVHNLQDCNLKHYELQLSFYMFALERHGFTPRHMQLTHYPPPDPIWEGQETNVIDRDKKQPVIYPLTYRKREVVAILNHYSKRRSK